MSRREARRWFAATCILSAAVASAVGATPERGAARTTGAPVIDDQLAARSLRERAQRLANRGEVGEALDLATLATNLAPNDPESWRVLAAMRSAAGHQQETASSYR